MSQPEKKKFKKKNESKISEEENDNSQASNDEEDKSNNDEPEKELDEDEEILTPFDNKEDLLLLINKVKLNTFLQGYVTNKFVQLNSDPEILQCIEKELNPIKNGIKDLIEKGTIKIGESRKISDILDEVNKKKERVDIEQMMHVQNIEEQNKLIEELDIKLTQLKENLHIYEMEKKYNKEKMGKGEMNKLESKISKTKKDIEIFLNKKNYLNKFITINKSNYNLKFKRQPENLKVNKQYFLKNFEEDTKNLQSNIEKWKKMRESCNEAIQNAIKSNEELAKKRLEKEQEKETLKLEEVQARHDEMYQKYLTKMEEMREEVKNLTFPEFEGKSTDYIYYRLEKQDLLREHNLKDIRINQINEFLKLNKSPDLPTSEELEEFNTRVDEKLAELKIENFHKREDQFFSMFKKEGYYPLEHNFNYPDDFDFDKYENNKQKQYDKSSFVLLKEEEDEEKALKEEEKRQFLENNKERKKKLIEDIKTLPELKPNRSIVKIQELQRAIKNNIGIHLNTKYAYNDKSALEKKNKFQQYKVESQKKYKNLKEKIEQRKKEMSFKESKIKAEELESNSRLNTLIKSTNESKFNKSIGLSVNDNGDFYLNSTQYYKEYMNTKPYNSINVNKSINVLPRVSNQMKLKQDYAFVKKPTDKRQPLATYPNYLEELKKNKGKKEDRNTSNLPSINKEKETIHDKYMKLQHKSSNLEKSTQINKLVMKLSGGALLNPKSQYIYSEKMVDLLKMKLKILNNMSK